MAEGLPIEQESPQTPGSESLRPHLPSVAGSNEPPRRSSAPARPRSPGASTDVPALQVHRRSDPFPGPDDYVAPSSFGALEHQRPSKVAIVAASPSGLLADHARKTSSHRSVQSQKSCSSLTDHLVCRYCFRDDHPEDMVAPCHCIKRSTVRWAHVRCLEKYMNRVHSNRCNICKKRMSAIVRQKSIWAWFLHPSTRRHQVELVLAIILSVTMMPVLYMAWAYAFFTVAPQVNWMISMVLTPYLIFQTSTWLGYAAYSFWIYYDGMRSWLDAHAVYKFNFESSVPRGGEGSSSR